MGNVSPETGDIEDKIQEVQGVTRDSSSKDKIYTLLEMHVDLDLEGFEDENNVALPYIVTICKDTSEILSIRANYYEEKNTPFCTLQVYSGIWFLWTWICTLIR